MTRNEPDSEARVSETDALLQRVAKAEAERDVARDALLVARRRIRVLRGADVLTTASSRGVVIWLRAIAAGLAHSSNYATEYRHLLALIETLEGNEP